MNPAQETFSELWANYGDSTFKGDFRNATRTTTYSRYAIVAWPAAQGVKKTFDYINVNAAVGALQGQKPVDAPTIRKFMDDAIAKLDELKDSYSRPRLEAISAGFCQVLCELLVDASDPALVNFFFSNFLILFEGKRYGLIDPLSALVCNFDWSDIGQELLRSLDKMKNSTPRHSDVEEAETSIMEIALRVADRLDGGAAQHGLLEAAVEKAATLLDEDVCSFEAMGLLWKLAFQCRDVTFFGNVVNIFQKMKPSLLKPAVEAFSQHLGDLDASDDKFLALASITEKRIEWLNTQLQSMGKPFSWKMPDALFPDNDKIQAFLRDPCESTDTIGVLQFNRLDYARNYAFKWGYDKQVNASFTLKTAGRGRDAYVTISKTREWFTKHQHNLVEYKAEIDLLSERFARDRARKRARHE